ncbi:MBL fold metallo-hydrolase [Nocardia bovistercoris]|uniref:MBL fold metallo-hydrolase n=1 Tax=Nocardia bovistercoris TaxID=2785916 RepID=A0A931N0U1_9NOCA|nr:MBL fold metallo-hydrolase [Nocardia bovistercoris]MBH0775324.1 MBL fold metallo-hydrolase [Nocardia bovistercoris]
MIIENLVTSGTFSLDGGDWAVDNNVWLIGDGDEVIVIDAAHDAAAIAEAIGDRRVSAIVCTHAHNDHINAAAELARGTGAPILLHPADQPLWDMVYGPDAIYKPLADGQRITVAGSELHVIHTPGHAPGAVCLHAPESKALFSGDTLFQGGPGATGRSFSSFDTIIDSLRHRILSLPEDTVVNTGHGESTTIGAEAPHLDEWIRRGH